MLASNNDCGVGKPFSDQFDQSDDRRPFMRENDADTNNVRLCWNPLDDLFESQTNQIALAIIGARISPFTDGIDNFYVVACLSKSS